MGKGGTIVATDLFEQNRRRLELAAFEKKLGGFVLLARLQSQTGTLEVFAGGDGTLPFHGDERTPGRALSVDAGRNRQYPYFWCYYIIIEVSWQDARSWP